MSGEIVKLGRLKGRKPPPPALCPVCGSPSRRVRRFVRRLWWYGIAALAVATYVGFVAIAALLLDRGMRSPLDALAMALLIILLLAVAMNVWLVWTGRKQHFGRRQVYTVIHHEDA